METVMEMQAISTAETAVNPAFWAYIFMHGSWTVTPWTITLRHLQLTNLIGHLPLE